METTYSPSRAPIRRHIPSKLFRRRGQTRSSAISSRLRNDERILDSEEKEEKLLTDVPAFSCGRISPRPEAQGAASFGIFRVWVRSRLLGIVGIEHDRRKGFPVDEESSSFPLVVVVALLFVLLLEVIRISERGGLSAPTVREDRASEKLNGHEHAEDFIRRWRRRVCRVRSSSTLHRNLVWGGGSLLVSGYKEKTIIVMARGGGDTHESDPGESFAQVVIPSEEVEHGHVHAPKVVFGQSFERREIVRER